MRVSPTFNAITAPILYHTVTVGDSVHDRAPRHIAFDIPVKKAWMVVKKNKQKTQGKERDLDHIRHVLFVAPRDYDNNLLIKKPIANIRLWSNVKSVRFEIPWWDDPCRNEFVETLTPALVRFPEIETVILSGLSRGKLGGVFRSLPPKCSKLVTIGLSPAQELSFLCPYPSGPSLNTVVHVSKFFTASCRQDVLSFADGLARRLSSPGSLSIVVVDSWHSEAGDMTDLEELVDSNIARLKAESKAAATSKPASEDDEPIVQYPTVRYIAMSDYLREYNCEGEFTEDELRPWPEASNSNR
jgi:hypothetical protein